MSSAEGLSTSHGGPTARVSSVFRHEAQRRGVHAVAKPGRLGPVLEDLLGAPGGWKCHREQPRKKVQTRRALFGGDVFHAEGFSSIFVDVTMRCQVLSQIRV